MGKIIGIDLGTTNSVAAYMEGRTPEIILTQEGSRLLPSIIAFSPKGERLVGNPAKSQLITNTDTIYSVKRLVGKKFSEVEPYLDQFNYKIVDGGNDMLKVSIGGKLFSPEEISAMILEKLKEAAEDRLHDTVEGAIITVPAYFNDSQRQATKDAGEIAGLEVLRIINEPTAASLAFSLDHTERSNVVVYDFGGGTIDISILEINGDVIKVLSTAGDINLGGNDFDIMITNQLVQEIQRERGVDLREDKMAMQRIRDAAESIKKELSSVDESEINLPFIAFVNDEPIHFSRYYTRKEFETLIAQRVSDTLEICSAALNRADLVIEEIDEILLVGGSTRIPYVQRRLKEFFNKEPNKKVNPDEIVAMGAALQASIAVGKTQDILLLDVIPLSLGVKTFGGAFTRVIDANTTIPTNRSLVFSTAEDNQEEVEIVVYQGEREIAESNKMLGKFTLTNIRQAPKGVPRIEVTFSIDINGILKVSAIDLSTKSRKEILVSNSGLLPRNEINEIKRKAEKFKESDLKKRELIKTKNEIVNFIYMIKKVKSSSQLEITLSNDADDLIEAADKAMENEVPEELEAVKDQLEAFNLKITTLAGMESHMAAPVTYIQHKPASATAPAASSYTSPAQPTRTPAPTPGYDLGPLVSVPAGVESFELELEENIVSDMIHIDPGDDDVAETDLIKEMDAFDDFSDTPALALEAPKSDTAAIIRIKQKILQSIHDIDQYARNLKLEPDLNNKCKTLLEKAGREVEKENAPDTLQRLQTVDKQLDELNKTLDDVVGISLGLVDGDDEPEINEPEDDSVKKDDTRPFKIYRG